MDYNFPASRKAGRRIMTYEDIPDEFYDALTKAILDSYDSKKFDKQELLNKYLPSLPKEELKYTQNWSLYNSAQVREKLFFFKILFDAIEFIYESPENNLNGRPPLDKYDLVKALCIKSFSNYSNRRTIAELKMAKALGYLKEVPHFNTLANYLADEEISLILHQLITILAEPLKEIETHFAVDATGFSQPFNKRWVEVRLEKGEHKRYKKLHAICGVRTNIITKAIITDGSDNDCPYYESLLKDTARIFTVREVSADAAYLSRKNCQVTEEIGGKPYIMPKKNVLCQSRGFPAWNHMIWLWKTNQALFKHFYHKRSNVEATFSSLKRKFGGWIRSKLPVAQENEVLCKVVCYNASILIKALLELDLKTNWIPSNQLVAQKPSNVSTIN